jgi:hypothetical protein
VAVLHDVIEDTPVTADDLRREGYPEMKRSLVEGSGWLPQTRRLTAALFRMWTRTQGQSEPVSFRTLPSRRPTAKTDSRHHRQLGPQAARGQPAGPVDGGEQPGGQDVRRPESHQGPCLPQEEAPEQDLLGQAGDRQGQEQRRPVAEAQLVGRGDPAARRQGADEYHHRQVGRRDRPARSGPARSLGVLSLR